MLRPWALWLPFPVVCWAAQKIGRITIDGYPAWHVSRRWIIVDKSDATAWRRRAERAEAALARAAQAGDAGRGRRDGGLVARYTSAECTPPPTRGWTPIDKSAGR